MLSRRDLGQEGHRRRRAARADPAPGRVLDLKANPDRRGARHGARGAARPGQGPGRDGAGPERHAARRRRLHLRHVLRPRARAARRARQAGEGGRPGDSGADPRLRGRAGGGRHVRGRDRRGRGARDRAEAPAARARGAEPPQREGRRRSRTSAAALKEGEVATLRIVIKADQGGPAEALADALAQLSHGRGAGRGRPPRRRRDHRERHPARQGLGRDHHRLPRAARHQRARRGGARGVDIRPTASSTRRWTTCAPRSRACSSRRSARSCSARPRCAQLFKVAQGRHHRRLHRSAAASSTRTAKVRVIRDGVEVYDGSIASASSASRTTCAKCAKASSAASASRTSTTSRSATSSSAFRMEEVKRTLQPTAAVRPGCGER